jgi:hypothetical protein
MKERTPAASCRTNMRHGINAPDASRAGHRGRVRGVNASAVRTLGGRRKQSTEGCLFRIKPRKAHRDQMLSGIPQIADIASCERGSRIEPDADAMGWLPHGNCRHSAERPGYPPSHSLVERGKLAITREARQSPTSINPDLVVVCGRPRCQRLQPTPHINARPSASAK